MNLGAVPGSAIFLSSRKGKGILENADTLDQAKAWRDVDGGEGREFSNYVVIPECMLAQGRKIWFIRVSKDKFIHPRKKGQFNLSAEGWGVLSALAADSG